jgi:hypothetical protein
VPEPTTSHTLCGRRDSFIRRTTRQAAPTEIVIEERTVASADSLTLRPAAGGGETIRFVALPACNRAPKGH